MLADVEIRLLEEQDIPVIESALANMAWRPRLLLLESYLFEQNKGTRVVLVALVREECAGYVTIKWKSDYPPFAEKGIPEIVDLNVFLPFRRQKVASALVDKAEELIFQRSPVAGIGVGLYSDYGPAQRMYVRRGYVPDTLGIAFRGKHVARGQNLPIDDDLILYFTKELEKNQMILK